MEKEMKCNLDGCENKAIGEILVTAEPGDPWYISVCQKHLNARKKISPDGKPFIYNYPQWRLK